MVAPATGISRDLGPVHWNDLMRPGVFGFKDPRAGHRSHACFLRASAPQPIPAAIFTIAAMELSERQRKYLRGLGHALNPVLLIGQHGVTPAVIAEAQRALHDHELIKVKFRGADRGERDAGLDQLATATGSILVQRIGHTALYYKRRIDRPGIVIPDS
jgi:RNA-binding protein